MANGECLQNSLGEERLDGPKENFGIISIIILRMKAYLLTVAVVLLVLIVIALVMTVMAICAGNKTHHIKTHNNTCGSVDVTGDERLLEKYRSCVTIEGNLRIQLIHQLQIKSKFTLPNLVEVTGYVIIYQLSHLRALSDLLPRLAVIRGYELFNGFSLIIFGNIYLEEPNLWNLTHVLNGAVMIEKNLCRGPPKRWELLSPSPSRNVIQRYGACMYPTCEEERKCTNITTVLHNYCTMYGGCYQGSECHSECAGGCHSPHDANACVACKNYRDGNKCVQKCSKLGPNNVHYLGYRCICEDECTKDGWTLERHGFEKLVCVHRYNHYDGTCQGANITSGNLGHHLKTCRRLKGNLEIMVSGGWNLTQQLEENLGQLEVVTGYIRVYGSGTLYSLNFLSSLEEIGGEDLVHGRYALYILQNENLQELWDWETRHRSFKITKGTVFFQHNPSLCREQIQELVKLAQLGRQDYFAENSAPCYLSNLEVDGVSSSHEKLHVSWNYNYTGRDERFVIGYYLYYREASNNVTLYGGRDSCNDIMIWNRIFQEHEPKKVCNVTVDNLKPNTRYAYYVEVYYTDTVKKASRSRIQYVTTKVDRPSPVRELKSNHMENTPIVIISWRVPSVLNGPLDVYEVKYGEVKMSSSQYAEYEQIDSVCDKKHEMKTPTDVHDRTKESPHCCACSGLFVSPSKQDLRSDRQHDINFENFVFQSLICKSTAKVQEPTNRIQGTKHNLKHRKRRTTSHESPEINDKETVNTINTEETKDKGQKLIKGKDKTKEVCEILEINGNVTLCEVKTIKTNATFVRLGISYSKKYKVLVKGCHSKENKCSDPALLDIPPLLDWGIYNISNFNVEEVITNETLHLAMKSQSNSSLQKSSETTLLLSWDDPPTASREDILAYIITYTLHNGVPQRECLPPTNHSLQVRGLEPGTYTFHIRLRSRYGDGLMSTHIYTVKKHRIYLAPLVTFLCGAFMVICIMELALWIKRRRIVSEPESVQPCSENGSYEESLESLLKKTLKRLKEDYVIKSEDLRINLEEILGVGCFGKVYIGVHRLPSGENHKVAVKILTESPTYLERILDEAIIMQNIESKFVLRLIGVVDNCPPLCVVMEYMERRDLKSFLLTREGSSLSDEQMKVMALEAADGMAYLNYKNLIHRDLAARNCMLDNNLTLKIGDFGLTRNISSTEEYYLKSTSGKLPIRWMAPESLEYDRYSARSDVWSYGILLWELATGGRLPYEEYINLEYLKDRIIDGLRLKRPDRGPRFFYAIMVDCWNKSSKNRPTFKQIEQRIIPTVSKRYLEYFQTVSFYHNFHSCDKEIQDDIDEGFNASGSSQEDPEAEHLEEDIMEEDDLMCLTPDEPRVRTSCAPLSCITVHAETLSPRINNLKPRHICRTGCFTNI